MRETSLCPFATATGNISTTSSTTSRTALGSTQVRLLASVDCFIKFGTSTVEAAVTDCPLAGGVSEYFSMDTTGYTHVAAITATGTGTLAVTACK